MNGNLFWCLVKFGAMIRWVFFEISNSIPPKYLLSISRYFRLVDILRMLALTVSLSWLICLFFYRHNSWIHSMLHQHHRIHHGNLWKEVSKWSHQNQHNLKRKSRNRDGIRETKLNTTIDIFIVIISKQKERNEVLS